MMGWAKEDGLAKFLLGLGVGMMIGYAPTADWWPFPAWVDVGVAFAGAAAYWFLSTLEAKDRLREPPLG